MMAGAPGVAGDEGVDKGPSSDMPAFVSTTNARELYGLREGDTWPSLERGLS